MKGIKIISAISAAAISLMLCPCTDSSESSENHGEMRGLNLCLSGTFGFA